MTINWTKNDIYWNIFEVRGGLKEIKGVLLTTVCVDVVGLKEANLEVVQDGRFVQVAECREVIFSHQDVRVPEEGKRVAVSTHRVLKRLKQPDKVIMTHTDCNYYYCVCVCVCVIITVSSSNFRWMTGCPSL